MAPRPTPRSGCPGRPALPCLAPQGTGSDWKNLPGTAQFLSTQTDTMFVLIYKISYTPAFKETIEKMAYIPLCREGGKLIEKINLHIFTVYIVEEGTDGVPCVKGIN